MSMSLSEVKSRLRTGPYVWPGGYPLFFVSTDGSTLSFAAVQQNWRQVVWDALNKADTGWTMDAVDVNWESDLSCDVNNTPIERAYT